MDSNRRECDEDVHMLGISEREIYEGRQITTTRSAANHVGDPLVAPWLLDAALGKVAIPVQTTEGEDTFGVIANRPVTKNAQSQRFFPLTPARQPCWRIQSAIILRV